MSSTGSHSTYAISDMEPYKGKSPPSSPTSLHVDNNMLGRRDHNPEPSDGSIVLGKGTDSSYVTRYRIVREKQREMIKEEMMVDMVPYCYASERKGCLRTVWQFVKSEPFLLCMHLAALVFSVLKRTLRDVEIDSKLELVHSCLETFVAIMALLIRLAAGREKFHEEKIVRKEIEHCPDSVRTHTLKRAMYVFYSVGILLVVLLGASLAVFITLDKLHWTVVTTNFALIVGGIGGNLTMQRLDGMVNKIREDQHKATIYEALLLLKESVADPKMVGLDHKIKKFCDCVDNTALFQNRGHIGYDADNTFIASNWNVPAMLAIQTSV